jgi:CDGSH-type Zn-finger protein
MAHPTPLHLPAGKHALCTCGSSSHGAFCDGSHQGTGKAPHLLELEAPKTVYSCSCGASGTMPFCDGSHIGLSSEQ